MTTTAVRTGASLGRHGRTARVLAATLGLLLITAGTVRGTDDDFPSGPLRMYSTRDDPNGQITQAVVQALTSDGRTFDVTDTSGAPRRAELEGRFAEFSSAPDRFGAVVAAYVSSSGRLRGHADAGLVTEVRLVRRVYPLRDGRRTGTVDEVVARWSRSR